MARRHSWLSSAAAVALALGAAVPALAQPQPSGPPPEVKGWRAVTVAQGIAHPWGMTWLPDGRMLVTAKAGTLHLVKGESVEAVPIEGLPRVMSEGQGALMDVVLHPKDPSIIYMTMSAGTEQENRTILVRGRFDGQRVTNVETIFRVQPGKSGTQHFGSRLLWLPDGTLLVSVGDGGNPPLQIGGMLAREQAQNLKSHLGSVLRLTAEGKPAPDNPFADKGLPEVWSYGHRNIQGLTRDPQSGRLWATEHGPMGGDELNLLERGQNYGWPLVTLGRDYRTGQAIGKDSMPGMVNPKVIWIPAEAPSGLAFYTGERFPDWRGSLFAGGLQGQDVRRIVLDGDGNVQRQERLVMGARVRDVREGPDGFVYALTDEKNGRVLRIEPE